MFSGIFVGIVFWTGITIILCFLIMLILVGLKKHKDKKQKHGNERKYDFTTVD